MNLSAWAIRRPLAALMIFVALCIAGLYGFHRLPVARFPDVAFPMVTVTVTLPGAAPSQLETEVTRKVEDAVATIEGLKRSVSTVSEGVSVTAIEFRLEADLNVVLDEVRDALDAGAGIVMLDNMDAGEMARAVELIGARAETEVSGNVTEERLASLRGLGISYISMGSLTHSVKAFDLSMKFL